MIKQPEKLLFKEADLIVSRAGMPDSRVVVIDNLPEDHGIPTLKQAIRSLHDASLPSRTFSPEGSSLISPDLIFVKQSFTSKEDLVHFAAGHLEEKGFCTGSLCSCAQSGRGHLHLDWQGHRLSAW